MKKISNSKFAIRNLEEDILSTLDYFSFFKYPPNLEEICTYLKKKALKRQITGILEKMVKQSLVIRLNHHEFRITDLNKSKKRLDWISQPVIRNSLLSINNIDATSRYTLGEYYSNIKQQKSELISNFVKRRQISINKLNSRRFRFYLWLLSLFPQIKLAGLSGSVAMLNAQEEHDIDLFIITAKNRLWTGRFIAIMLAKLIGIHRFRHSGKLSSDSEKARPESLLDSGVSAESALSQNDAIKHKNKVCLNLLFDENDLKVPKNKQTGYVAHEVLQMKPLLVKGMTYLSFIDANKWVFDIFPNAKSVVSRKQQVVRKKRTLATNYYLLSTLGEKLEGFLKRLQLLMINRHRTTEIVTATQLWFHPDDFEKKILRTSGVRKIVGAA